MDEINSGLSIYQNKSGLTFGTDAFLLSAYVRKNSRRRICDIGCGTGVISFLLLKGGKASFAYLCDIQSSFCELSRQNARVNSLSDRVEVINEDVNTLDLNHGVDAVVTNPPYMKSSSGAKNECEEKHIARHETTACINSFMRCAARCVKDGGDVYVVYRPDRAADLFYAMKSAGIEPKRCVFVYPTPSHKPCIMLTEGKAGGKSGMTVTKPLIIYRDKPGGEYTAELDGIYKNNIFPEEFYKA